MFLKNKNIIFKIRRSKVTDYAALNGDLGAIYESRSTICESSEDWRVCTFAQARLSLRPSKM